MGRYIYNANGFEGQVQKPTKPIYCIFLHFPKPKKEISDKLFAKNLEIKEKWLIFAA